MGVLSSYVSFTSTKLVLKEKRNDCVRANEYVTKVIFQYKIAGNNTPKRMRLEFVLNENHIELR